MADLLVADSDVLIDFLNNRGRGADAVTAWIAEDRLAVTTISVYELAAVGIDPNQDEGYQQILENKILDFDLEVAVAAGEIAATLRSQGRGIGVTDPMIAGACITYGLPLATRNRAHFERIPGLELVDF